MKPKVSVEDLLRIVAENKHVKPTPTPNYNDVHRFVKALNIKEGRHRVTNAVIYKAYKLWSTKPFTRQGFFSRFARYFKPQIDYKWRHYMLNYRAVELLNKVDNGKVKF
jgi:hypothetical protein